MVSSSVFPTVADSSTPGHSYFIDYDLIALNILFNFGKDTLPSYSVAKILGVFLLQVFYPFPCVVFFPSPVPINVASNHYDFHQTNNVICSKSQ